MSALTVYDKNKRVSYGLARLIASKLVQDPSLIQRGRKYLERHVRLCPHQRRYYELWSRLLHLEPQEIAARLLALNTEGELLRDTRPVFYVPTSSERNEIVKRARLADGQECNSEI